jgi:Na+-transporting methylmalonyl-CoA/oxaloacetate decarboxylase beta subunit
MLEVVVELLFGLLLSALILLVGACILGSLFAALRAVNRESDGKREKVKEIFASGAKVTVLDDRMIETGVIEMTNPETHYGL